MRVWIDKMYLSHLETAEDGARACLAQVVVAQHLADELGGELVRRKDGTYYLDAGPAQGAIPVGAPEWPAAEGSEFDAEAVEAAARAWLTMLADALGAELVYRDLAWYLNWPGAPALGKTADEEGRPTMFLRLDLLRWPDGSPVTAGDEEHAAVCRSCSQVIEEGSTFFVGLGRDMIPTGLYCDRCVKERQGIVALAVLNKGG